MTSDVVAMCFDTTSTNNRTVKGACSLLESHLNKNLIYIPCRHHVHELIVGGVFSAPFGPSRSPNIAMLERFQQYWPNIDRQNYASLSDPRLADPLLQELKSSTVSFLKSVLAGRTGYMPRDDNKELMKLCLLILGESPIDQSVYRFRQSEAYHMATWMSKVIYNFKIYLFRDQFHLTRHHTELCLFVSHVYVKSWITFQSRVMHQSMTCTCLKISNVIQL